MASKTETDEQVRLDFVEAKRLELEKTFGCEVHAFEFKDPKTGQIFNGYLQEPDRLTKMQCIDMAATSYTFAAKQILDLTMSKDASHPYIWEDYSGRDSLRDAVYLGAIQFAQTLVRRFGDVLKKR